MAGDGIAVAGHDHDPAPDNGGLYESQNNLGRTVGGSRAVRSGAQVHYSTATPDQLRWILAPTTLLVELFSQKSFEFESYTGYMSSDHTFVIAAPCAGVNFLITAFSNAHLETFVARSLSSYQMAFHSLGGCDRVRSNTDCKHRTNLRSR